MARDTHQVAHVYGACDRIPTITTPRPNGKRIPRTGYPQTRTRTAPCPVCTRPRS